MVGDVLKVIVQGGSGVLLDVSILVDKGRVHDPSAGIIQESSSCRIISERQRQATWGKSALDEHRLMHQGYSL